MDPKQRRASKPNPRANKEMYIKITLVVLNANVISLTNITISRNINVTNHIQINSTKINTIYMQTEHYNKLYIQTHVNMFGHNIRKCVPQKASNINDYNIF